MLAILARLPSLDISIRRLFYLGGLLVFLTWILWLIFLRRLPPEIPLWYSLPYGQPWLASRSILILLPSLNTGVLCLNRLLAIFWSQSSPLILSLLAWGNLLVNFIFFIALTHILFMVF